MCTENNCNEFIVLYAPIANIALCKNCVETLNQTFVKHFPNAENLLKVKHSNQEWKDEENRCPFVGCEKKFNAVVIEIK